MPRQRSRPRPGTAARAAPKTATAEAHADTMARYKVEAVSRAMLLLEAFRRGPASLSAEALAQRTGLPVHAVEATLATLGRRGLIQRVAGAAGEPGDNGEPGNNAEPGDNGGAGIPRQYRLGLAWLRLADVKRRQLDIRAVALPVMGGMRDAVNETASLSIRLGASRVNIEYAEGHREVRRIVQPGFHVALHVGAGGRALMSGLDREEIEAYLAPVPLSQLDKTRLIAAIEETRRDGYAIVGGEVASDTAAISAPVRNHVGEVVAAVSLSLPQERLTPGMQARCVKEVVKGAREISLALGFDPIA